MRCTYSGVGTDFSSAPIDVVAEVKSEKVFFQSSLLSVAYSGELPILSS